MQDMELIGDFQQLCQRVFMKLLTSSDLPKPARVFELGVKAGLQTPG